MTTEPRLGLAGPASLDEARRRLYDAITGGPRAAHRGTVPIADDRGRLLGPFAVMLLTPDVGDALQRVGATLRFRSGLAGRERELGILSVAAELACDFEWLAHESAARDEGLTDGQLAAVRARRVPDGLSETEAMVCRLALLMARDRTLGDDDYKAGVALLGQEKLAELTWLAGYYGALALGLAVFRPELPAELCPASDCGRYPLILRTG